MKKFLRAISLYFSIIFLICQAFVPAATAKSSAKNTDNFVFTSAKYDFYLEKTADDSSRLRVEETLVANFPNFNQNHGIERRIPFTNQGGKNLTVPNQKSLNFSVTRDGKPEPFQISNSFNHFTVRIGSKDHYVQGEQIYHLKYEFQNVITNSNDGLQELYWNTNGTGWKQPFHAIVTTLHIADPDLRHKLQNQAWCYTGKYGSSQQKHCTISQTDDGFQFAARMLIAGENLTFTTQFQANTFKIPAPRSSYFLVWLLIAELALFAIISFLFYKKAWLPIRDRYRKHYSAFIPPRYAPPTDLTVAQIARLYIKPHRNARVATLLELIVQHKMRFIRGKKKFFGGYQWSFEILSLTDLSEEQNYLVQFLAGTKSPELNKSYKIKQRAATSTLTSLHKKYDSSIDAKLKQRKLLLKISSFDGLSFFFGIFAASIIFFGLFGAFIQQIFTFLFTPFIIHINTSKLFAPQLLIVIVGLLVIFFAILVRLSKRIIPVKERSEKGLEYSRYLDGLKLYIKMAEKDRLEFFQSQSKAPIDAAGIVNLYEKLLPYAALFGLEKSWMKHLSAYCQAENIAEPSWSDVYLTHAIVSNSFTRTVSSASSPYSGGSSSSSSSSGSGGGGFSGGGGGGGGGGW